MYITKLCAVFVCSSLLRQNALMYITKLAYCHGWGGIIHVPIAVLPSIKDVSFHLFRVINSSYDIYDINMFEVFYFYLFIWWCLPVSPSTFQKDYVSVTLPLMNCWDSLERGAHSCARSEGKGHPCIVQ